MQQYRYRELRTGELSPQEQGLALLANEVAASKSRPASEPAELHMIVESVIGEIVWPGPILGICRGRKIYILTSQCPKDLIKTVFHEARHAWQRDHGKFDHERERDAELFALELTLNLRGQTFDHLQAELICLKYSARSDARPAYARPKVVQPPAAPTQPAKQKLVYGMPAAEWIRFAEDLIQRPTTGARQRAISYRRHFESQKGDGISMKQ
jgi:hypothetical protein